MKLIIVESPTKTKSLSKYLGNEYEIVASMGHIRDLPKSKMGIEIWKKVKGKSIKSGEYEFVPSYEIMDKKEENARRLRTLASKAEEIILASDPDREGEAIAWHVKELLSNKVKGKSKGGVIFKRIAFHSITKDAILEAIDNPREIDMNLVNSQQARRFLDRLVGYKLSPILWKKVRRGLSAGRVQSVAVRLIVEREREIEAHKPQEYWQVKVQVKRKKEEGKGEVFWVELAKISLSAKGGLSTKKQEISNKEEAEKVLNDLENGVYKVLDVKKTKRKANPYAPFKTSTLQQAAANVLGWSAKRTMNVAQRLYEQGDITYHRTDSFNLAPVAIDAVREFVKANYGENYLPEKPRLYKVGGKVVAQEAHEAVRPTNIAITAENFVGEGDPDQKKLYSLIWRRTIACQMAEAIFDDTRVEVESGRYLLTANGVVTVFDGWKKLFPKEKVKSETGEEESQTLPEVESGEMLEKQKVEGEQKFTQPPARFNDASIIKELEKRGIGRPSTYAAIISTIIDRRYVEQKEKRFYPTSIGKAVVDFLVENFAKEMDYEFTAKMETELDEVAAGKLNWEKMLSNFWTLFSEQIIKVDETSVRVGVPTEGTGEKCPECKEGEIVIRDGRFGKFLSCDRYPECKYKAPYIIYIPDVVCEKCGKRVVQKKTGKGKDFYGCEDYPNCTWASWKKPQPTASQLGGQVEIGSDTI